MSPIFEIASSSAFCFANENSVPPVPLVKTSTGLSTKIFLVSLKISTIKGTNWADPPSLPVACITLFGVAGTLGGKAALEAGGRLSGRGGCSAA